MLHGCTRAGTDLELAEDVVLAVRRHRTKEIRSCCRKRGEEVCLFSSIHTAGGELRSSAVICRILAGSSTTISSQISSSVCHTWSVGQWVWFRLTTHLEDSLRRIALAVVNEGFVHVQALIHVADRLVRLPGDVAPQPIDVLTHCHVLIWYHTIERCRSEQQDTAGPPSHPGSWGSPASCRADCLGGGYAVTHTRGISLTDEFVELFNALSDPVKSQ